MAVSEKALDAIFWQPGQWQAAVQIGALLISMWTWPQRHEPESGSVGSGMEISGAIGAILAHRLSSRFPSPRKSVNRDGGGARSVAG